LLRANETWRPPSKKLDTFARLTRKTHGLNGFPPFLSKARPRPVAAAPSALHILRQDEFALARPPREGFAMPDAKIISFESISRAHRVRRELADWRQRLRLAYERQWDWRAREICQKEIRRLSDMAHETTRETT